MRIVWLKPIERTRNMLSFHLCPFKIELSLGKHHDWINIVVLNVSFQTLRNKGETNANASQRHEDAEGSCQ
jgi:hypothetical protein